MIPMSTTQRTEGICFRCLQEAFDLISLLQRKVDGLRHGVYVCAMHVCSCTNKTSIVCKYLYIKTCMHIAHECAGAVVLLHKLRSILHGLL